MRQYFRDLVLGFASILVSLKITLRYLFTRAVTVQYPEEKRQLPTRALTQHVLTIDLGSQELKCTACDMCARICPANCIHLEGEGKGKARRPKWFIIDHNLCMYCNLCVEVCPFDAISMWTGKYELGGFSRTNLVYDMETLHADRFYPTIMSPRPPVGAPAKAPAAAGSPAKQERKG
jgi:NADH-quinone oxidoreductase subunit I